MMRTIFDNLTVQHIQIEEHNNKASVEVRFLQNNEWIASTLVLDHTDLNQLFAKMNACGIAVSLSDDFNCYSTEEGRIFTLNCSEKGWSEVALNSFIPVNPVRQLRA